jgi:8-oxo-dGTP diphosphatase
VDEPLRISTSLIDDGAGRIFLVRKRGTDAFMQAGGKIDARETPLAALLRELEEELAFAPEPADIRFLGIYRAVAANEPGAHVEAHVFHVRSRGQAFRVAAELEEGIWIDIDAVARLPLAPLTREHILPLARNLHDQASWTNRRGEPNRPS